MKKAGSLSAQAQRHNLALLSRFFSWAIVRGHATVNPVKMLPEGQRPQRELPRDVPWLKEDALVVAVMAAMPEPINLMFYLANRSGLRTGEVCGLRMADLEHIKKGTVRVRYSYDGPLKEDKHQTGKMKWVPAARDAAEHLAVWCKRRKLAGAKDEDLAFPAPPGLGYRPRKPGAWPGYRREYIGSCWSAARDKVNADALAEGAQLPIAPALTWYQATRHSFVSRNLKAGASLDEVSAAVGHSSPVVTKANYDHFVRKQFSAVLTAPLGMAKAAG